VVVNYRTSEESARAIVSHIQSSGGNAVAIQANVFEADACEKLIVSCTEQFGQVDICVIGPGGEWHQEAIDSLDSGAPENVYREIAPLFHLMPLVLPGMYRRKWGRLVGIALHPTELSPAYSYNVGKAARTQAFLQATTEAWRNGVTVNVIAPGPVPSIKDLRRAVEQCHHGQGWESRTTISPQDIAEGVAFLCSESGRFITGCVLPYLY